MSRTRGRLDSDLGQSDGQIFISAITGTQFSVSGTVTNTRNAAGDYSVNVSASSGVTLVLPLDEQIFRYGVQDWFQEQFGSSQAGGAQGFPVGGYTTVSTASASAGSNVNVAVISSVNFTVGRYVLAGTQKTQIVAIPDGTHITLASLASTLSSGSVITENLFTTPADVTGPPPFTGTSQLTPVTSPRPKGIKIRQVYPWYLISTANATTNTVALIKNQAANGAANVTSNIVASTNLLTAFAANPYVTPVQVPAANVAYQTSKYGSYNIEWVVATPASSTMRLYGVFLDVEFNYN